MKFCECIRCPDSIWMTRTYCRRSERDLLDNFVDIDKNIMLNICRCLSLILFFYIVFKTTLIVWPNTSNTAWNILGSRWFYDVTVEKTIIRKLSWRRCKTLYMGLAKSRHWNHYIDFEPGSNSSVTKRGTDFVCKSDSITRRLPSTFAISVCVRVNKLRMLYFASHYFSFVTRKWLLNLARHSSKQILTEFTYTCFKFIRN